MIKSQLQNKNAVDEGVAGDNTSALSGTNLAQNAVSSIDGDLLLGTANSDGARSFVTDTLANGAGFTAPAMDWSGNAGAAAAPVIVTGDIAGQSPFTAGAVPPVTVANGSTVEIDGVSAQSVTFAGTTGTLVLDDAPAFTGQISGLTGTDAIDLADVSYGANTTATFSGNAKGGTLTITNGAETANIALVGDYLDSGWTLSSDGHGGTVVVDPPLAGGVYPNATNTGVPAGVTLTPSGGITITAPGIYSGLDISGGVTIDASDVTLEDCIITMPTSGYSVVNVLGGLSGVTIENCEIYGPGASGQEGTYGIYVEGDSQVTINADNIHDVGSGVTISGGQVVVENSYIHNLNAGAGTHYNGIQYNGGGGADFSLLIQNNSIINTQDQTDAVMIDNGFGAVNNVTITNNLLYGGDYPIYVDGSQGSDPVTNVSITNNDIGLSQYSYGYTDFNDSNPTFTGNVEDGATLYARLPTSPIVLEATAPAGNYTAGNALTLTLYTSEAVTVSGTPTLTLNDGGTATYTGGTGTDALTFSYTVAAGQNTSALAVTAVNGTIADLDGNALSTSNLPATFANGGIGSSSTAPSDPPAAPVISTGVENSNESVTLTGTAPDGSTVTVSDGSTTALGTATASSTGAWSFTTADLAAGTYVFTATDTTSAGTSAASSPVDVTVPSSSPPPSASNLVANGNFATGNFTDWTLGGNDATSIYIDTDAEGGSTYAVHMGSVGSDGTLSQTIATVAGQTYTLSFWLQNEGAGPNDFAAIWNGQTLLSLTNAAASGYTEYTYTVTATGSSSVLEFSAMQDPSNWDLDNISLTANGTSTGPTLSSIVESPRSGDLDGGKTVMLTLTLSEAVTVAGGTPTLMLNDGGTATYTGGSGTDALSFSYTVAAGQNTSDLTASAINLNAATITDGAGNAANLSLTGLTQTGPQVDTTTPVISSIAESPSSGDLNAGKVVTMTLDMSEVVTVNTTGGSPTLTLNDGGTATYVGGSGTNALTFSYAVLAGQNTPDLMETAVNLNGATIEDGASNAANLSLAGLPQGSPQIDTTTPTVASVTESPSSGDLGAGKTVTLTLTLSEAVTVAGGTPTLTLNDGGTATYTSGSGTNALTFSYTVGAGQSTSALAATAVNLKGATIEDGAGNAANVSLTGLTQTGPQIPPAAPIISTGVANSNESVTLTGTAPAGSTVTVSDGSTTALGTATASSTGAWSFTTADLAAGSYAFTVTDTTAAGTSAASRPFDVTVTPPPSDPPAAPVISTGVENSKESVTLTGTAPAGSTVTVSDGGTTALGTATASSTGAWSFTTADLAAGSYTFTATDTTSAGTSAASGAFDVTVTPPPAAPVSVLSTSKTLGTESNKSFAVTGSDTSVTFGAGTNNTVTLQGSGDRVTFGVDSDNTVTLQGSEERVAFGGHSDNNTVTVESSGDSVTFGSGSSNNTVALGSGDSVSLSGGSDNAVTFSGSTGTLILKSPSTFSGEIFNFTGNGSLSGSDQIDLKGINYNSVHDSYANGVLTVTDGTHAVKLDFNGSYTLANFAFASDGSGGTIVYDPPTSNALAPTSSGQTSDGQGRNFTGTVSGFEAQDVFDLPGIAFDAPTTLGYLPGSNQTGGTLPFMDGAQNAKIALLGNYMASSFAVVGDNHGGTMVTEAWQASNQSLLTHPQHT